jgi:hypothetical protein
MPLRETIGKVRLRMTWVWSGFCSVSRNWAFSRPGPVSRRGAEQSVSSGFDRAAIADAILRHLSVLPGAKDSARGVVTWCAAALGAAPPETLVQEILEELERQGRVASSLIVDGTRLYYAPPHP